MIEELVAQIKVVVETRRKSQEMANKRKSLYDEFLTTHSEFLGDVVMAAMVMSEAETALRELTLQAYAKTGDKTPAPGVGIREVTKLEYNAKIAYDWAIEHTMALKLDTSAFEKIAKVSAPSFVRVFQEPQATIATQLES